MEELEVVNCHLKHMFIRLELMNAIINRGGFLDGNQKILLEEIIDSSRGIGSLGNQISLKATELFYMIGRVTEDKEEKVA